MYQQQYNNQDQYQNGEGQQQQKPNPAGQYELYKRLKLLGEGSFGKAYLVEGLSDGRKWVIKQISLDAMSPEEKKESYKEAKILEQLNHPNIVKFKEIYKTKSGKLCIVMEYADGGDLQDKIKKQRGKYFKEEQILDWFTQICLAMKHVHDRKILHRDLKGQNIFLTAQNLCKLGDFGIARVLNKTFEKAKTMVGTPYYLSPEIINSVPYSFKSDVWSIGVVLYELCSLKPPFSGDSLNNLALNIVKGVYQPIPSTYSSDLKKLVGNLLSNRPENRYSIQQILQLPFIRNRIKNFLSETIKANEFSHTILHNQKIVLDDDFKNIKNVNGAPPPSVANQLKEQRAAQEKLEQQQKLLPNIDPSKQEEYKNSGQKPPAPSVQKNQPVSQQMRPQTPQNNQVRQIGVKNPSPSEQRPQQKKPSSLDAVPHKPVLPSKQPSSGQQTPVGKENSSENKKLLRQPSKDVVIKNNSVSTEQDDFSSQANSQQQFNKKPQTPSVPSGQQLKQNPSQQKIMQKVPSKPSIQQQKIQRPQTAAQNISKQQQTPKSQPSGKPLYPAKPSDRKESVGQIPVVNSSSKSEQNKPPVNSRPITAVQKNVVSKPSSGAIMPKNVVISREEAAYKRAEHLRVVKEQEDLKKKKLEEFKKAKFEASINSKKDREAKRNQMLKDLEQKRQKNNNNNNNVKAPSQNQFAMQQQQQQQQNKKQEIQIEWMGTMKPDQPPERPKNIDQKLEEQRIAAQEYNREIALKKKKSEEIERQKKIQEQLYEEKQREKEKKQREMFLMEQMQENSSPKDYPQRGNGKAQNPPVSNNRNVPTREEIEYTKMLEEMKSLIDDEQSNEESTFADNIGNINQNINFEETERDDYDF